MRLERAAGLILVVVALALLGRPSLARAIDVVTQFEGLADANNAVNQIPPDDNLGVGPSHVFEMVNSVGRITDKAGTVLQSVALPSFFAVDPGFDFTDPKVLYDATSGRWFATYVQFSTTSSAIILAVSTTSDPTGSFCRYRLGNPVSESFFQDQPLLGVSDDKVIVSYNGFPLVGNGFLGAGYYVVNKGNLLACGPSLSVVRIPPDANQFTLFPVQSLSSTGSLHMVTNNNTSLTLVRIDGVPGAGMLTTTSTVLGIRTWNFPPQAPQAGSFVPLDTGDERVASAVWRDNSLWLAGNERCTPTGDVTPRSCLRFVEIRTDSLTVRQDMTFGTAGKYYYYPALQSDAGGNLLSVFTASSSTEFAQVRIVGRLAGDPLNTLQPSQLVRAGGGAQTNASGRMGDYSGAAVDPVAPSTVWVSGEYIRSTASADWGTYIAQLRFPVSGLSLAAAVLPGSRSVQVSSPATAFATILASGVGTATGCGIAPVSSVPASFLYQTTDPATNQLTGTANTPASIAAGGSQTFVIAFTPTASFAQTDVQLSFGCANAAPAPTISGVNTLWLSASGTPVPDIVALAATLNNDGIVNIPGANGTGVFAVATVNVGAGGTITASADTGAASLPITIQLCQTDPATAQCISAMGSTVIVPINANATPTFSIFVTGGGMIPFDPAANRIFVRFKSGDVLIRGSTSVAVRTQ